MKYSTTAYRLIAPASIVVLLSGCGNSSLTRTFGLTRDAPDEFTVVTRAPLSMPPDFTLRPPQPGALRPQDASDRTQAESALVPEAALGGTRAGVSPGQAALVRDAGGGAPADIRQRVDQEARIDTNNDSFIDKVLYWRKPDNAAGGGRSDGGIAAAAAERGARPISRERRHAGHSRQEKGLVPGSVLVDVRRWDVRRWDAGSGL